MSSLVDSSPTNLSSASASAWLAAGGRLAGGKGIWLIVQPRPLHCRWNAGDNSDGVAGNGGDSGDLQFPQAALGDVQFTAIVAGYKYACGLAVNGSVFCTGSNNDGELGQPSGISPSYTFVPVSGAHIFVSISGGEQHVCGLDAGGLAWCWGELCAGPEALPCDALPNWRWALDSFAHKECLCLCLPWCCQPSPATQDTTTMEKLVSVQCAWAACVRGCNLRVTACAGCAGLESGLRMHAWKHPLSSSGPRVARMCP